MKSHFGTAGKLSLLLALALGAQAPAEARMLDPARPADAVEIMKRTQCGVADNVPAVYRWTGRAYGRQDGQPDKLLFRLEGMNIRQCVSVEDPKRGKGFRQVSREIMLYLDPKTGEVLRQWTNPYTGETMEVFHVANDPVNGRPTFPLSADGTPYKVGLEVINGTALMPVEVPLFYQNPLAGDYQEYVGNRYHAMEIFDFAADAKQLLDTRNPTAYPSVSWVRIADWMPWMRMQGRDGQMVFNAVGVKLKSFDELPKLMRDEIAASYPTYTSPPPGDDARPNETTWTAFKRWADEKRKAQPTRAAGGH